MRIMIVSFCSLVYIFKYCLIIKKKAIPNMIFGSNSLTNPDGTIVVFGVGIVFLSTGFYSIL